MSSGGIVNVLFSFVNFLCTVFTCIVFLTVKHKYSAQNFMAVNKMEPCNLYNV